MFWDYAIINGEENKRISERSTKASHMTLIEPIHSPLHTQVYPQLPHNQIWI